MSSMHPTKFKAVRKDTKVFTTFTSLIQGTFEKEPVVGFAQSFWYDESAGFNNPIFVEVIPETLCRFVQKINNVEFYTNDLVKLTCDSHSEKLGHAKGEWLTKVIFDEFSCQYLLQSLENPKHKWPFNATDFNGHLFKKEIIGNIHDQTKMMSENNNSAFVNSGKNFIREMRTGLRVKTQFGNGVIKSIVEDIHCSVNVTLDNGEDKNIMLYKFIGNEPVLNLDYE